MNTQYIDGVNYQRDPNYDFEVWVPVIGGVVIEEAVQNTGRVISSVNSAFVGTSNGNGVIVANPSSGAIAG